LVPSATRRVAPALAGLAALLLAACSSTVSTTPLPSAGGPPADCARVDADSVIALSANNLKFSAPCMVANAGESFTIHFANDEAQPHNVEVFTDTSKATKLFGGDIISGPNQTIDYSIDALDAGEFYFDCQVHAGEMNGTLYVVTAGG
jgi:plastocyanin